jgi:hypothetical protein
MSTEQQIRDAIKAKMDGVANVGIVHTRERYAENLAKLKPLYVTGGKICGWYIRLIKTSRTSVAMGRIKVVHYWKIVGFMSFDDAARPSSPSTPDRGAATRFHRGRIARRRGRRDRHGRRNRRAAAR